MCICFGYGGDGRGQKSETIYKSVESEEEEEKTVLNPHIDNTIFTTNTSAHDLHSSDEDQRQRTSFFFSVFGFRFEFLYSSFNFT
jgi:hypothetical protein